MLIFYHFILKQITFIVYSRASHIHHLKQFNNKQIMGNHGVILFGSLGNSEAFLMFFNPMYNITTLSKPIPPPAWG